MRKISTFPSVLSKSLIFQNINQAFNSMINFKKKKKKKINRQQLHRCHTVKMHTQYGHQVNTSISNRYKNHQIPTAPAMLHKHLHHLSIEYLYIEMLHKQ